MGILVSHLRMMAGMKAQGIDRKTLPYASPFQPYFGYFCLFVISLVIFFKGFTAFIGTFDYKSFITNYIGLPLFAILFLGWKIVKKTRFVSSTDMDLSTGAREISDVQEEEDEVLDDEEKLSKKQRIMKLVKVM